MPSHSFVAAATFTVYYLWLCQFNISNEKMKTIYLQTSFNLLGARLKLIIDNKALWNFLKVNILISVADLKVKMCRMWWHLVFLEADCMQRTNYPCLTLPCDGCFKCVKFSLEPVFALYVPGFHENMVVQHGRLRGRGSYLVCRYEKAHSEITKNETIQRLGWLHTNENRMMNLIFHFWH